MVRACAILVIFLLLPSLIADSHTNFIFNQFNASSLELIGSSSVQSNAICLNLLTRQNSIGRAFYLHPVRMKERGSLNSTSSFSTSFVFSIVPSSDVPSGFGIAFLMTPHKSLDGFSSTQYMLESNLTYPIHMLRTHRCLQN